jgi:LysR family glycine cleavage system transcriptional activator
MINWAKLLCDRGNLLDKSKVLKSIQVFDAAARTKNLTRAAENLNTSQSTVSYHIKKLEAEVGARLFDRSGAGLTLTPQGEVLAAHTDQALAIIQAGLDKVVGQNDLVRVAVLPMFASRWLSSRLGGMWEANPGLQISFLNHSNSYTRMDRPGSFADMGIQWGRGDWEDFRVTRLRNEELVAVCSPDYLVQSQVHSIADLKRCTLLHVDDKRMWSEIFKDNLIEMQASQREMLLEDRHFQLNSTINGLGVSLFSRRMVQAEINSGVLVQLFGRTFSSSFAYHLAVPKLSVLSPAAEQFKSWLVRLCREDVI